MRILAVTNMYPSDSAPGRAVFIHEQVKGLKAIGLSVRVLFINRWREGPLAYYRFGSRLKQECADFAPDLIHVMYGGVMAQQIVRWYHFRPVVVTFHGSDLLGENLSGWVRKVISRYGVWCSRKAAQKAEGVVVVARRLLAVLPASVNRAKVRVLPCGIDLEQFQPMDPVACRRTLGWANHNFHVLFVSSNGDPVKRPELAQATIQELRKQGINAELHQMSNVPYSSVPLWFNASDALLLTSLHEGSPTVVKEALACSLPIVSVDVGDVAERIETVAGCYLAKSDVRDLAHKLFLVHQERKRLNCRSQLQELSILTVAQHLRAFYESIAAPALTGG